MKLETLKKLRNKEPLKIYNSKLKVFHQFQLNKEAKHVCWKHYVSKDRKNWININLFLSLKDIDSYLTLIKNS